MTEPEALPVDVRMASALSLPDAVERLRATVRRRPAIEERRHWLTERCVTGEVDGPSVRLDVKRRYAGRLYARNSFAVRFLGQLQQETGGTVLSGEVDYRLPPTGGLMLVRLFAIAFAVIAVVVAIEGVATSRSDEVAFGLVAVPALVLLLCVPRIESFVERSAAVDALLLRRFLASTLEVDARIGVL